MPTDSLTVRTALDTDREPMHRLGQQAFQPSPSPYDEAMDRTGTPIERRLVAVDGGEVVGRLGTWELGHWLGGRIVPMGGIGGVAVEPAYRGRGVAGRLLRAAIADLRERGEVLSTLYPMNHTVYRRYGWELAGAYPQHAVPAHALAALPRPSRPVTVRWVEDEDLEALRAITDRVTRDEPGAVWFGADYARRQLTGLRGTQYAYLAEVDGVVTGSVSFAHSEPPPGQSGFALVVRHLAALDLDSELALWRLLASHHPVATEVRYVLPPHVALPALRGERDIRPAGEGWCWMTRLVDAAGAIAARGYAAGVDAEAHLDLVDAEAPWNAGPHVLRVTGGVGVLEPGGRGTTRLGTGALASAYTGWTSARRLAAAGLVERAEDADLAALDDAFTGPTPWARCFF